MFSKSLIKFSVDGWGCIPTLLFDLRPNYGGGDEDNGDLPQKVLVCTAALSAPTLQQATTDPRLCWRLQDTHGQVWVSIFWGHCSFLLGPGVHKVLFLPSKSLFLQACVSSSGSLVGLMVTSSKRAYAIPRSAAPRVPDPVATTADPYLLRRHSNTVPAQSLLGLWFMVLTRFVWALWTSLAGSGFDSKFNFSPPTILTPPKMDSSWWKVLTKWGPLKKGMASQFSILALRTSRTVWKSKKIVHWKTNSPDW